MNDGGIYALVKLPNVGFWLRLLKNSLFAAVRMPVATRGEVFFSALARWPGGFGLFGSCD